MKISLFLFTYLLGFHSYTQLELSDSLSAKDAVFTALKNNYDIQASNAQIDISNKSNTWSEAGLFPTVNLNIGLPKPIEKSVTSALKILAKK